MTVVDVECRYDEAELPRKPEDESPYNMPNGFHGSQKEWRRLEAPYLRIDPLLMVFAERHRIELHRNYRDADRSLHFDDALSRTIWVYASDKYGTSGTYDVSIVAHQDRPERYMKSAWVARRVPLTDLEHALEEATSVVVSWSENDLEMVKYEGEGRERKLAERFSGRSAAYVWAAWIKEKLLGWITRRG